jgi:hypothetical protein
MARGPTYLSSGVKVLRRETLRTGGDILTDIAKYKPGENPRYIVSKRVTESAKNLVAKVRERGHKRKRREKRSPK